MNLELDKVFNTLKPKLREGDFDYCDNYIDNIIITKEPDDILIAILVATLDWKDNLKSRRYFYTRVEIYLLNKYDVSEVVEMLIGLK